MSSNTGSCQRSRYGVIVCKDNDKLGGVPGLGKRYIDAFGSELNSDLEEWHIFSAVDNELPSEKDLDAFNGFFITGGTRSSNDLNTKWVNDLKKLISAAAKNPSKARIVGVCFGHQVIAVTLGGEVTLNPSKKIVLGSEEIKTNKHFKGNEALRKLVESHGSLRLLEYHEDCVATLPPGAQILAQSASCKHEMIQYTENIFGTQSHAEFSVQDFKEHIIPEKLAEGKIDENEKKVSEESLSLPLDSAKMAAALKKFVSKEDSSQL